MARPKGTTQYPEDEPVLDDIQAGIEGGTYSSREAGIRANLDRVGGPTEEAKIRRLQRKLSKREAKLWPEDLPAEDELAEILAELPSDEARADYIAKLDETSFRKAFETLRASLRLSERGIDLKSEEGRRYLRAFLKAKLGDG